MKVTCSECSLVATITPTARDKFSTEFPNDFAAECLVLRERLAAKERLKGSELECPYLDKAIGIALDAWRRRP